MRISNQIIFLVSLLQKVDFCGIMDVSINIYFCAKAHTVIGYSGSLIKL